MRRDDSRGPTFYLCGATPLVFANDLAPASFMSSEHGFQGRWVGESGLSLDKLQIRKTIIKLCAVDLVFGSSVLARKTAIWATHLSSILCKLFA